MGEQTCPKCGYECSRDSADVGVGVIHGPWGCPGCGWSNWPEYDRSNGPSPRQADNPGWYVDQWGGMRRVSAIADRLERLGVPRGTAEDVFTDTGGEG